VLAVTDDQHPLAGTFTHQQIETAIGGPIAIAPLCL
jgi:hypothetical protein